MDKCQASCYDNGMFIARHKKNQDLALAMSPHVNHRNFMTYYTGNSTFWFPCPIFTFCLLFFGFWRVLQISIPGLFSHFLFFLRLLPYLFTSMQDLCDILRASSYHHRIKFVWCIIKIEWTFPVKINQHAGQCCYRQERTFPEVLLCVASFFFLFF